MPYQRQKFKLKDKKMKFVSLVRFIAVCALPLLFVACGSRTTMFVDFDKVVDSKDFAEVVGNEVKFDFGSGNKANIISYKDSKGSAKIISEKSNSNASANNASLSVANDMFYTGAGSTSIGKENKRFTTSLSGKVYKFGEVDVACGYALLKNLVVLRDYAKKVGGTKVVNIISYYKKEQRDSKDRFLCSVGKNEVNVRLKADIAQ